MRARTLSFRARLAVLALLAASLRAFYIFVIAPDQQGFGDWIYYHSVADAIAEGHWFVDPFAAAAGQGDIPSASHAPLYPFVLSGISLAGGTGYLSHRALGIVLGAAGVVLLGLLGKRLGGERVGTVAAALAAVYPIFIAADGALLSEVLYTPLLAATLLCAYRVLDGGGLAWSGALGAGVATCALTRSEAVLLIALLALPVAWGARAGRPGRLAATVAAFALVLAPWTIRNLDAFGETVPVSTQGGALVAGANCRDTYYGSELGGWSFACLSAKRSDNEARQSKVWQTEGVEYAQDNAGRVPLVVGVRLLKLFDFYEPRRQLMFAEGRNHRVEAAGIGVYWLALALALMGAVVLRHRGERLRVLAAPVAMVVLSAVVGYGVTRLRHAAELVIVVLAAVALVHLDERRAERRSGGVAAET